jgi:hypothetical protein
MNMLKQVASTGLIDEQGEMDGAGSCLTGLYLVTDQAMLYRFDAAGGMNLDAELSERLSFRLQALLDQYRSGAVDELSLALITDTAFRQQWDTGSLIFHDRIMDKLPGVDQQAGRPFTLHESQRKACTLDHGMRRLLNATRSQRYWMPAFCPVLFAPEVEGDVLRERYGVDFALNRELFEVLDLAALFASNDRMPRELLSMVQDMRQPGPDTIGPVVSAAPGSRAAPRVVSGLEDPRPPVVNGPVYPGTGGGVPEPPDDSCFNHGDAVTGWLLEWFAPFNELTDTQRDIIAGYELIRKAKKGACLIEQGTRDDISIYLVEGSLTLEGPEGGTMTINAGTRRSRLPISVLTPHVYHVTANTDVSIIIFSQRLVRRIIEIATTYTSVDPLWDREASTAAISNEVQALYLQPVHPACREQSGPA